MEAPKYCDLRMPSTWLRNIAESIDEEESWIFKSRGGNTLHVVKHIIPHEDREDVEVLSFTYNPERFDFKKKAHEEIEALEDEKMITRLEENT